MSTNPTVGTPQGWIKVTLGNYAFDPNGDTYTPSIFLYLQKMSESTLTGESTMLGPRLDSTGWAPIPWVQSATNTWTCEYQLPDTTLSTDYGFFGPDKIVAEQDWYGVMKVVTTTSFSMTLANTPAPTENSPSTTSKHLPVIIIPGVGGSELDAWTGGTSQEVWPAPGGTRISQIIVNAWDIVTKVDMSVLRMNSLGTGPDDPNNYVFASDILRTGLSDFYGSLVTFFLSKGYVEGSSLFVFPYDFRLDNAAHLDELDRLIDQARITNSSQKVVLIAHSMGGLIATAYVNSSPERAAKVDSIVTMGTPFWGSPKCYYAITQGYTMGNAFVDLKQIKSMEVNWPACYELLPRIPFNTTSPGSYLTLDQSFGIAYNGPYSNERWHLNSGILSLADSFGSLLGTPDTPLIPSNVKLYTIIGYGTQSLNGYAIREPTSQETSNHMTVNVGGNEVVLVPQFSDGDGTVQMWGAENKAATAQYYIKTDSSYFGESALHSKLPKNSKVQGIIWNIIDGNPPSPESFPYSPINGGLKSGEKIDLTIHSSANLEIVNDNGGMMGWNRLNGTIFEEMPQGIFLDEDGIQYASIQSSSNPYTVFINGTETGTFTLTATVSNAGTTSMFSYADVPVIKGTVAQLSLNPPEVGKSIPPLAVTTTGETTFANAELISRIGPTETPPFLSTLQLLLIGIGTTAGLAVTIAAVSTRRKKPQIQQQIPQDQPLKPPVISTDTKFCVFCGAKNKKEARFCRNCGNKLTD